MTVPRRRINVALNRPTSQSSASAWPTPDLGCCTDVAAASFWAVDLQSCFPVRCIVIWDRPDADAGRAFPLVVETSPDATDWQQVCTVRDDRGGMATWLEMHFAEPRDVRHVRLRRIGEARHFHLDRVEVFADPDHMQTGAQLAQDLWVLEMTGGRSGGSFVEIGSTDGVCINNTCLLERRFGWRGVCVEPNPAFYADLTRNRTAMTFQRAVFGTSGARLAFIPVGEYGTLAGFQDADFHADLRADLSAAYPVIEVDTISPADLFAQGGLPPLIDYLSLDTEGSEWEILRAIDHARTRFALITIEHNHVTDRREAMYRFLKSLGYRRLGVQFDDWYWHPAYLAALNGGVEVDVDAILDHYKTAYGLGEEPD